MTQELTPPTTSGTPRAAKQAASSAPPASVRFTRGGGTSTVTYLAHQLSLTEAKLVPLPGAHQRKDKLIDIDLKPFLLNRDSFLYEVLSELPCPIHETYIYSFRRFLKRVESNPEVKDTLRSPKSALNAFDILALFNCIEADIAKLGNKTAYTDSVIVRTVFNLFEGTLGDGNIVGSVKFPSRFSTPGKGGADISGPEDRPPPTEAPADFDSLQERDLQSLKFTKSTQEDILNRCQATLDEHQQVIDLIQRARQEPLPENLLPRSRKTIARGRAPDPRILDRQTPDELLSIAAKLIETGEWHLRWREDRFPYARLEAFKPFCPKFNSYTAKELVVSEHYLPKHVVVACANIIMAVTALNIEVVSGLTESNILRRPNGMMILKYKGRGGTVQKATIASEPPTPSLADVNAPITNPVAARALNLLLQNARNISKVTNASGFPLLVSVVRKGPSLIFQPFIFSKANIEFWNRHGARRILPKDLRRTAAHIELLTPGGSILTVQALLGHADLRTTVEYLNSSVIPPILDANIRRFMRKIHATALWATGREDQLEAEGLTKKDIQPLLFPLSATSEEPNIADEWLQSDGATKLAIGPNEVHHCAIQHKYYLAHYKVLLNENPRRFLQVHLPRLIFCVALRRVILLGPHKSFLVRMEKKL